MTSYRKERVAEMLLGFLATELRQMRDPRLESVTVTDVQMTPDLKTARVYWTTHSLSAQAAPTDARDIQAGTRALKGAAGLLRKRIAEELDLRYLPDLQFFFDESIDRGMRIDYLLNRLPKGPEL